MTSRVLAMLVALGSSTCACTTWHECSAHDRQRFLEATLPASEVPPHAKAIAHRIVATGEGETVEGVGLYTHASQYKPATGVTVDFAREEVVRVASVVVGPKAILWVAETDLEVLVGALVEPTPCTAYPSSPPATAPVNIVIALTTKPVRLVQHATQPACVLHGQG
jgi:hypothetical protein